jgi:hypothetical protein
MAPRSLERLHPTFTIGGGDFVMATHLLTAISLRELGPPIASLSDHHSALMAAIVM